MNDTTPEPVSAERFAELAAEGYNRIPVVLETLADLDTPLSTYLKLAKGPYSYLLESAHGGTAGSHVQQWSLRRLRSVL